MVMAPTINGVKRAALLIVIEVITSLSKIWRKLEQIASSLIRTLSYIKVRSFHPSLPLSGPNIGCVQSTSNSSGSTYICNTNTYLNIEHKHAYHKVHDLTTSQRTTNKV